MILEKIVKESVSKLKENEKRMRFIYSRAELVPDLFRELNLDFEHRSFGIIPKGKNLGGNIILEKLQKHIYSLEPETELIDFTKTDNNFEVYLKKNRKNIHLKSKYLVLATGGYAGTFNHTDNFRYKNYHIFDMVKKNGGKIINHNCLFIHPFSYDKGKKILIGNEVSKGEFIDSKNNFVFDQETRQLIKNDDYHEIFNQLLKQIDTYKNKGSKVYFVGSNKKLEITPTVHYTAGGIKTDYMGEVIGCKNLFAIGECRADGSRNGGRLPGYPFTSAIISGKVLGDKFS